jgi:hypothetical protein
MLKHLKLTYPNLKMGSYTHIVHSLHIYERHFELVKEMLSSPFSHMSYPHLNENLITKKGHPTDNMNLLESDILLGFDGELFDDSLFEWLALNSNGNDI